MLRDQRVTEYLRPQQNCGVTNVLLQLSLERITSNADKLAPTLCELLRSVRTSVVLPDADRKDRDLVYIFCLPGLSAIRYPSAVILGKMSQVFSHSLPDLAMLLHQQAS